MAWRRERLNAVAPRAPKWPCDELDDGQGLPAPRRYERPLDNWFQQFKVPRSPGVRWLSCTKSLPRQVLLQAHKLQLAAPVQPCCLPLHLPVGFQAAQQQGYKRKKWREMQNACCKWNNDKKDVMQWRLDGLSQNGYNFVALSKHQVVILYNFEAASHKVSLSFLNQYFSNLLGCPWKLVTS